MSDAPTKKYCYFCFNKINQIDYLDIQILQRFISSYAKIVSRRRSGVCVKHQRKLAEAIKRARIMAILPFVKK
ncbi:30S ribosomal protein S18 [Candidatus Kuenenbacteria bacterium]|nr:30S ribosomal protein S18 [Candidatus Kuenenbacteria bacterium]